MDKDEDKQAMTSDESPAGVRMEKLVLASGSPRRAEILGQVGWPHEVCPADVDESIRAGEDAIAYVERLAGEKAGSVAANRTFSLVLGADTSVVIEGELLGKPRDDGEARRMLQRLQGVWHEVVTGVALVRAETNRRVVAHERTRVRFASMSEKEIDWYVKTNEPLDKAGGYGVQGRAALFIERIEGDYLNVVGLPVRLVSELARKL